MDDNQAYGPVTGYYSSEAGGMTIQHQLQMITCVPSSAVTIELYTVNEMGRGMIPSSLVIPAIEHSGLTIVT